MWLYGVLYTSSLIGTMALTLQIPLSIIADSFVRGAQYSPMFNIGAACIFAAFIFVNLATLSSMPKNKIKVPRKIRHFCCCTVIEKSEKVNILQRIELNFFKRCLFVINVKPITRKQTVTTLLRRPPSTLKFLQLNRD